tara:strand:- start:62 stop:856 length:795 start_codon:yes stop_codon:yes gene_type:complete
MFFVRCYRTGAAKSGTTNVAEWDDCPNFSDFTETCQAHGEGKYVLFQRGKGIRGMKKVNEYIVESAHPGHDMKHNGTNRHSLADLVVFAAEEFGAEIPTVALKKNIAASELDDSQLLDVMDSMADKDISNAEEFQAFQKDIKAILTEVRNRGMSSEGYSAEIAQKEAESKDGFAWATFGGGVLVGALGGGVAVHQAMRKTITDLEERLGGMESSLAETEKTLKKQAEERAKEKKAEEAVRAFDNRLNLDASFLSNFNGNNGPQY